MIAAAAHGPSALWYATRGAGAMTLVLLTASVVLGVGEVRRWRPAGAPRFAVASLHRTISLLAVVLLVVHIATTLLDVFPHIAVANAAVPFATDYRPLWMGLGTIASDLMLALVVTSLVRRRMGYRAWRGLHWLAYACWPVALAPRHRQRVGHARHVDAGADAGLRARRHGGGRQPGRRTRDPAGRADRDRRHAAARRRRRGGLAAPGAAGP